MPAIGSLAGSSISERRENLVAEVIGPVVGMKMPPCRKCGINAA